MVSKKVDSNNCCVRSGAVVLTNLFFRVDDWKKMRLEDLVAIPVRRKNAGEPEPVASADCKKYQIIITLTSPNLSTSTTQ